MAAAFAFTNQYRLCGMKDTRHAAFRERHTRENRQHKRSAGGREGGRVAMRVAGTRGRAILDSFSFFVVE